jgi:hypothetical protein
VRLKAGSSKSSLVLCTGIDQAVNVFSISRPVHRAQQGFRLCSPVVSK